MNRDSIGYTALFTFLSAFLFVALLALANDATKERVAANQRFVVYRSVLSSLGVTVMRDNAEKTFKEYFPGKNVTDTQLETSVEGTKTLVRIFSGKGLWGTIKGAIAFSEGRIVGIDFISHNETPGLGGRIEEAWFKDQFRNEKIREGQITIQRGSGGVDRESDNGLIDGIAGATQTSQYMETIVNREIEALVMPQEKGDE